ncbi:MAG: polyphosphate kinase 1, partial [Pseudomonadota bacterium]
VQRLEEQRQSTFQNILDLLAEHDVKVLSYTKLSAAQKKSLRDYYIENIFPLVTPQSIDPAHPFPFISNLSLNLLVIVRYPDTSKLLMARIKVPVDPGISRFLRVSDEVDHFVPLEAVMANNLDLLFPGMEIESCEYFRVTRNVSTEREEDKADDLMELIESEVRDRRFAPIVRLQVSAGMEPLYRGRLAAELSLDEGNDVFVAPGLLAMSDLFELVGLPRKELHDAPHEATDHPNLRDAPNVFHVIRETGSLLLHHPYQFFATSVERFLRDASTDPKVRAIKMTLYRTSSDTRVIDYLVDAARNGKQVAVVVELKARFDEAANIQWAERMEEAGIHVTYGVVGLKTHSKVILAVRQDLNTNQIRRYAHIGTGNYHAGTAKLYGDLGLLTCDNDIGADLTELFNYLTTGCTPNRGYRKILPSPGRLKRELIEKIGREIELHQKHGNGLVQFKMNALEDIDVTRALYQASQAGVKVDLIVRDTCRLRPGIPGLSESATVISIVGRFLEHTRIYYFHNNGQEEYFIGSADAMQRNLESRVEVVAPVEDPALCDELRVVLDTQLNDQRSAWEMRADGSYYQRQPENEADNTGSQQALISFYQARAQSFKVLEKEVPIAMPKRRKVKKK